VDNNGEREKIRLIGMDTPESPKASVVVSYQHCPACWIQQFGQTGFSFRGTGFGFVSPRLSAGTGLSAPDMDRVCEIVVIPDVIANIVALATAQTYAAVSGPEWRATERIRATTSRGPWEHPADPFWQHSEGPGRTWTVWSSEIFQTGELIRVDTLRVVSLRRCKRIRT
jgi:hypothetical protein